MASASAVSSLPRSAAGRAAQAGNARWAASTARSMSSAPASATAARTVPSAGLMTSMLRPARPSVSSPSMYSLVCTSQNSTGWVGNFPLLISSGILRLAFSHTRSMDRLGE